MSKKFSRKDHHIYMGMEAAERCIKTNGLQCHFEYYCPLFLEKNASGFKEGWDTEWARHNENK